MTLSRIASYRKDAQNGVGAALRRRFSDREGSAICELLAGYFAQNGWSFCIIFDGFDYIEAADFIFNTNQQVVLDALSGWLYAPGATLEVPCSPIALKYKYVVSLRTNTFGRVQQFYNAATAHAAAPVWYVVPPSFAKIFNVVLADAVESIKEPRARRQTKLKLTELARDLFFAVTSAVDLPTEASASALFNQNVRHQVNYARDILSEIFREVVGLTGLSDAATIEFILDDFQRNATEFTRQKQYRLVDCLLCGESIRFVNFVKINDVHKLRSAYEGTDVGKEALKADLIRGMRDDNRHTGYVGNVLNYHIPYKTQKELAFLIEKPRILRITPAAREYVRKYVAK